MTGADEITVRPGQVWADNDPRSKGRQILVVEVVREVQHIRLANPYALVEPPSGGRRTRIRLDRFRDVRSGYRLIGDAPGGEQS